MTRHEQDFELDPYVPESIQRWRAERRKAMSLDRRHFIKVTGLTGGGLVLGLGASAPDVVRAQAGADVFEANPFVQVRPDNTIVIFSKNPDVGQGVKTAMPMIVAEELDVDWEQVVVEQADIDQSRYGVQIAGGSTSIPSNWMSLRQAGATARAMLVAAAELELGVDAAELTTESGHVIHEASSRRLSYGELAERASTLPVPDPVSLTLKARPDWKLLGRRITGVDNEKIVTGQALFGIDQQLPDMVYATLVKAPAIGARPVSANLDHVKGLPGVIDAFLVERVGDPIEFGIDTAAVLPGVAIVANSTWATFKARDELEVEWDESEAASDSWSEAVAEATRLGAAQGEESLVDSGDVDTAFAEASATPEGFYTYQFASHADLEPQNCTAWFKGDSIEIWAPTQTPTMAIPAVANLLGLPEDRVTLHQLRGGGGFGRRLANDSVCEVAWIARQLGVPVKAQWSREDDMGFDYYRPGGFHSFRAALNNQGRLSAWQDHFITFGRNGRPISSANLTGREFPVNALPNARITQTLLPSGIPSGPWRAPGSNALAFAIQSFLHECSAAAGRDHLEFLLELFEDVSPPRGGGSGGFGGGGLDPARAAAVTRRAAEEAGWGRELPAGRGLGLAFYFSHRGHFAEVAEVSVAANRRLTVHKVTVAGDIGPIVNMSGAENQVQGSVIDALSTLMGLEITFEDGRVEQKNFDRYPILRMSQAPAVDVHFIQSDNNPTGVGEPAFPPAAPAICNAIYAATGHRVRTMPLTKEGYSI
jgi:isoquinoline 1-oxidoreductase beta subunit